jgi:hypothetical protein
VIEHRVQTTEIEHENRAASRKQVLRQGLIKVNDRAIYCAVHDLSATGAKLQVYVELPGRFEFSLLGHRLRVTAEVKWSQGGYTGVAFTQPLDVQAIAEIEPRPSLKPTYRMLREARSL